MLRRKDKWEEPMLRRDFLSSLVAAATGALPGARSGDAPDRMTLGLDELHDQSKAALCEQLASRVQQLSRDVEILTRELAEADQQRSQIFGVVHAMRSPLACIDVRTELMRYADGGMSDELRRHLDMNARSCRSLAELINDAFAAGRRSAGIA